MQNVERYAKNIEKITEITRLGKIEWKRDDEEGFYFQGKPSKEGTGRMAINKTENIEGKEILFLEISDEMEMDILLDSTMEGLGNLISKLYDEVESMVEGKELAFFDDVVKNLH